MSILSSFIHPHVVANLNYVLSSVEQRRRCLKDKVQAVMLALRAVGIIITIAIKFKHGGGEKNCYCVCYSLFVLFSPHNSSLKG